MKIAGIMALLIFVLSGAATFALRYYASTYANHLEASRVLLLKRIAKAEDLYHSRYHHNRGTPRFASLDELIKVKLLQPAEVDKAGVVMVEPATADAAHQWWASVEPLHPLQGRAFFINQTKVIYYAFNPFSEKVHRKTASGPAELMVYQERQ